MVRPYLVLCKLVLCNSLLDHFLVLGSYLRVLLRHHDHVGGHYPTQYRLDRLQALLRAHGHLHYMCMSFARWARCVVGYFDDHRLHVSLVCGVPFHFTAIQLRTPKSQTSRPFVLDFRAHRTVCDDFEPTFAVVEFLATPDMSAAFLSEVFFALELVVVARFRDYHTCQNQVR